MSSIKTAMKLEEQTRLKACKEEMLSFAIAQKEKSQNKPLLLLLGETHIDSNTKLLEAVLVKELAQRGYKISLGYEAPYNTVSQHIKFKAAQPYISENRTRFQLKAKQTFYKLAGTPVTNIIHTQTLLSLNETHQQPLNVHFNDMVSLPNDNYTLDCTDPEASTIGLTDNIDATTAAGIYIRNQFMLKKIIGQIKEENPDFYIQIVGSAHLQGHTLPSGEEAPYEESIMCLAEQETLSSAAIDFSSIIHCIHSNIPSNIAEKHITIATPFSWFQTGLTSGREERKHIEEVASTLGINTPIKKCLKTQKRHTREIKRVQKMALRHQPA